MSQLEDSQAESEFSLSPPSHVTSTSLTLTLPSPSSKDPVDDVIPAG